MMLAGCFACNSPLLITLLIASTLVEFLFEMQSLGCFKVPVCPTCSHLLPGTE